MILTFKELSKQIGLHQDVINLYACRAELSKYDTTKYNGKRWSRALDCNKKSMSILYKLATQKYHRGFTQRKFLTFYKTLEE